MQKNRIQDEEFGLTEYDDTKISLAADIICTLFAPLITTIPIFVLYFVSNVRVRLGIIMAFTTVFSIRLVFSKLHMGSRSDMIALRSSRLQEGSRSLLRHLRLQPFRLFT